MANSEFENGVNGATGEYLFPKAGSKEIADIAKTTAIEKTFHLFDLQDRNRELRNQARAPAAWVDPTDLANAGWGAIFTDTYDGYTLEALKSEEGLGRLLKHRQQQATRQVEKYYREFDYRLGQSKNDFLKAYNAPTSGAVDPDRGIPYYLLIVGDPRNIPYEFQYQLDVQYAVGRIYFDTLDEYANYARSVVRAETEQIERPRQVSFWGPYNEGDKATELSSERLVKPLSKWLSSGKALGWECPTLIEEKATKKSLCHQINSDAPALLFTASHGVGYPKSHPLQKDFQGSLIGQEWNRYDKVIDPEKHLFSADDLSKDANLHGLIAFHFACYGLGTPQFNNFKQRDGDKELAQFPFVSRLPQKLLSHEKGGALAVIGHIDRAFSSCFQIAKPTNNIEQLTVFKSVLKCLTDGLPIGYAMEFFNQQYAELSSDILNEEDDFKISSLWTISTDARNYAIFGDPAVRVAIAPTHDDKIPSDREEPKVWFKPSGKKDESLDPKYESLMAKVKQLEQEVKELREENQRLKEGK